MYIRVHVIPNTKRETIVFEKKDVISLAVKEPRENNRANIRVCEIIADLCGILPKEVRIISGHHHATKLLSLPDHVDLLLIKREHTL